MGWRSVIITQHAKLTYSMNMMIVQTKDGINQIPISDINLLLVSTSQAVITSALISKLAENQSKIILLMLNINLSVKQLITIRIVEVWLN